MDGVLLARMQFAANITFRILFPAISIALGWALVYFRVRHLRATDHHAKRDGLIAYRLWTKVFALTFALGVCATLPVIIAYTVFAYRVFRSKTSGLHYA